MKKGEIAFTTIVTLVIVAVVLIAIIIWFLPAFSDTTKDVDNIKDASGVGGSEISELKCNRLCSSAEDDKNDLVEFDECASDFCTDSNDCANIVTCDIMCTGCPSVN